jgi:hypothetical protein
MTSKEAILEMIRSLPDDVSAQEVVAQILNRLPGFQELENREKAARLIESWMEDRSGYDARVWPGILQGIERNRLAGRSRFGPSLG